MKDKKKPSFSLFLDFFPEINPPLTVTNEAIKDISKNNKTFPEEFIAHYLFEWNKDMDEFTEYVPCFSLPTEDNYYSVVYWKASLLSHEFILATIDKKTTELINQKVIAGTISDGLRVVECVAKIEEDKSIHIMIGATKTKDVDPLDSEAYYMEILPEGKIESYKEENPLSWLKEEKSPDQKN